LTGWTVNGHLMGPYPADEANGTTGVPVPIDARLPALRGPWEIEDPRQFAVLREEETHLRDYWLVLLRHRWTVLAFLAVVVLTTALVTFVTTPLYRATVLIEIGPQNPNIVAFQDVVEMAQGQREFFQTQYDVLRSRNLAARVIEALRLEEEPAFNPSPRGSPLGAVRGWVARLFAPSVAVAPDPDIAKQQALIGRFLDHIAVEPRRTSFLVEVSFLSPDPELAARVANAVAEQYVALSIEQRIDAVQKGRGFIERQVDVTRESLEQAEEQLQAFSKKNAILTVDEGESVEFRRLSDLNDALTAVQSERMQKESLLGQVERGEFAHVSAVMNHPVVNELLAEVAQDEAEYSRLSRTFTSAYPQMERLAAKVTDLRTRIETEIGRLTATLRADYEAAKRNEQLLKEALAGQQDAVADLNRRAIDYKILKRQVDTEREIYESLLKRLKEVEVSESIKASNIHVLDAAELPFSPDRPNPVRNLMLALFVGLCGGVALAFFQEYLDSSIKSADDVERHLRLATLGAVPMLRARRGSSGRSRVAPEMVAVDDAASAGAEAMRTLRASLFLSTASGPPQRILVTSARPEEGKTCVSVNLAVTLAQMGKRVVLIDTDLRRPRLHRIFQREIGPGLSSFLTGNADLPSVIQSAFPDKVPNLDLVLSGPVPPNPVELIDSREMMSCLDELCRSYDFVVADGPPSLGFADVPLLSRQMGGILLVVKCGVTPRKTVKQAAAYLTRLGARVLGVTLNQVAQSGHGYDGYYSYYQYYGHASDHAENGVVRNGTPRLAAGDDDGSSDRQHV
jgi:capsular exopolysaccharide synthesis family protein